MKEALKHTDDGHTVLRHPLRGRAIVCRGDLMAHEKASMCVCFLLEEVPCFQLCDDSLELSLGQMVGIVVPFFSFFFFVVGGICPPDTCAVGVASSFVGLAPVVLSLAMMPRRLRLNAL